jgi:peptidoglycan-associated lipoprotein
MDLRKRLSVSVAVLIMLVSATGCRKKIHTQPAATAPALVAPAPIARITASPTVVTAGNSVELSWVTTNATKVLIDGLGDVPAVGTKSVAPTASTSYHLEAKGEGGTADSSVRVTVNAAPVAAPISTMNADEEFRANVQDIFFDYDKYDVRAEAIAALAKDAAYLSSHPNTNIIISGYCDERGSNEYNLALGENRAESAKKILVNDGVAASRIRVISYGKEKPFCTDATEACWQQNRRAGFTPDH